MSKNILDRKIPSLAGIGVIAIGIIVTTLLVKGPNPFQIKANPSNEPKNIQITNISDSSFTVTYTTDDNVIGTIKYGDVPEDLNQVTLDDRDQLTQKVNEYKTHSITANNLTPNTNYYFTITSDNKTINNDGKPFLIKTGNKVATSPTIQIPMAGRVINPQGSSVSEGLVILNINGAQKISSTFRDNGNFTIPLNNLRTSDLSDYFILDDNSTITVIVTNGNLSSRVNVSKDQLSPVPIITLSNNYDFITSNTTKTKVVNSRDVKFPEFDSEIRRATTTPSPIKNSSE